MIFRLAPPFLCLFFSFSSLAQTHKGVLKNLLTTADSIVLISHKKNFPPNEFDINQNMIPLPELVSNNQLNQSLVIKTKRLLSAQRHVLFNILTKSAKDPDEVSMCFSPHHAILIYAKSRLSYIDVCFTCQGFSLYGNLTHNDVKMSNSEWDALSEFFTKNGFD